jgi:nucleotide-binding universal stress UspA family protein
VADTTQPGGAASDGGGAGQASRLPGQVCEHVPDLDGAVVVGTDGSGSSRTAMAFAADEAHLRGVRLVVLRGWSLTHAPRPGGGEPGVVPPMSEYEQAVAEQVRAEVSEVLGEPPVPVDVLPVHASAADCLVEASRTASLVVVGHAHRGRIGKLLGSVSDHVLRHARGPVAVVP